MLEKHARRSRASMLPRRRESSGSIIFVPSNITKGVGLGRLVPLCVIRDAGGKALDALFTLIGGYADLSALNIVSVYSRDLFGSVKGSHAIRGDVHLYTGARFCNTPLAIVYGLVSRRDGCASRRVNTQLIRGQGMTLHARLALKRRKHASNSIPE